MNLRVKSLQGSTFTVQAEPSDTIGVVKGKIETERAHLASTQKLIYSGKILKDEETIASCGVGEKEFFVLMISKPKVPKAAATPAAAAEAATPAAATAAATTSDSTTSTAPEAAPAAAPAAAAATTASETPAATANAPASGPPGSSQFLTGGALESAVNNIVEMGFEKSEVQKAMRASFNNPERAVEYLMTGIPEHLNQPQAAAQEGAATSGPESAPPATAAAPPTAAANPRAGNLFEAAAAQAQGGGGGGERGAGRPGAAGGAGGDTMAALRSLGEDDGEGNASLDLANPLMLAQLRQLVQQNPAALTPLVQALAQSNPQLAAAMADNPEAVLNLLASGAGSGEEGEEGGVALPSMSELNTEDRTAVEQIMAMGIEERKAIEVYLMCGRNVEMAVQYYFENPQDFDD